MRVQRLGTDSDGELFVFSLRSGMGLLRALAVAALLSTVAIFWDFEMIFLAATLWASAFMAWLIMRWVAWKDIAVSVTGTAMRRLNGVDAKEALATVEIQPGRPVVANKGLVLTRENGGKTVYYRIEHAGAVLAAGLTGRREAEQMAEVLNQTINPTFPG